METIEEVNIKKKKKTGVFCFLIIIRSTISKFVQIRGGYAWKTRERCIPNTTNRGCILPYVFIVDETWRRSKNSASTLKLMPAFSLWRKEIFFSSTRKGKVVTWNTLMQNCAWWKGKREERLYSSSVSFFSRVSSFSSFSQFHLNIQRKTRCKYVPTVSLLCSRL